MGVISRKICPACVNMCVCCPALRSRSRHPVKRYKKLLAELFSKSSDASQNEKKIIKLCEYAAKNPSRIPEIAKFLEERCYKELPCEDIHVVNIVTDAYNKLLCLCKEQMSCFALSLLNVATELLNNNKQDAVKIVVCQTLMRFIYSQSDCTYAHNIEKLVKKVCSLAVESGDEHQNLCMRASSLQCVSAMLWFMAEFSHIFVDLDEIVRVTLENYHPSAADGNLDNHKESCHNVVDEVIGSEGRAGGGVGSDTSSCSAIIRPRPKMKEPSRLTSEEVEMPKVWAQICLQRMVELGKESTTMRHVLHSMFCFFDSGRHWTPEQGTAMIVLSDLSYFMKKSGNQQLILSSVIRHLDHENISHNPGLKSSIIQVAANLAKQIRAGTVLVEFGLVSDLYRHLRTSLEATAGAIGEEESSLNISLQNSILHCLLEIAKRNHDAGPFFDTMAYTLEELPLGTASRATMGSLMILANVISSSVSLRSEQLFPDFLLVQILKVMLHDDMEARLGAHQIFSILLFPNVSSSHLDMRLSYQPSGSDSVTGSASSSITTLLEKLWMEKNKTNVKTYGDNNINDGLTERAAGSGNIFEGDPLVMKLSDDQIEMVLSAFWIQAKLPDNLPTNIEALSNSFILTLISARMKNPNCTIMIEFIQLALSLRKMSLDSNHGTIMDHILKLLLLLVPGILSPACQRSIFLLSTGMLMFAAKLYQIPHLSHLLKSSISLDVDPFLGISDDLQIFVKPKANLNDFGSLSDNIRATSFLSEFRTKISESDSIIIDILAQNLSVTSELDKDDVAKQLRESFTPDEAFLFCIQSRLDFDHNLDEDDARSVESPVDPSWILPEGSLSHSTEHIMSVEEHMKKVQELAGDFAETSVSASPVPSDTMVRQCETLEQAGTKLLSLLADGSHNSGEPSASEVGIKLPPTRPFDYFLKAAGY